MKYTHIIQIIITPASSNMLVSKIMPRMSKYSRIKSEAALYPLGFLRLLTVTWTTEVILKLIRAIPDNQGDTYIIIFVLILYTLFQVFPNRV